MTGIAVSGSRAAWAINAFCALDLHLAAFPVGMCTRTLFGKAEIILWRTAAETFPHRGGAVVRALCLGLSRGGAARVPRLTAARARLRRNERIGGNHGLQGKVALITGAGNGIGRATALGFARDGAKVVVVDRDTAGGEGTAGIIRQQGGDALFVAADVTKSADVQAYVKAALDAYGSIDCFHNNAGIEGNVAPTAEYDEEMFDRVMA